MNNFYFNVFSIPVFIAVVITTILMVKTMKMGNRQGQRYFLFLMLSCMLYALFYFLEISTNHVELSKMFLSFQYFGAVSLAPFFLLFSLKYVYSDKEIRWYHISGLFLIPLVILCFALTNEKHFLLYSNSHYHFNGYFSLLKTDKEIIYWLGQAYAILLSLIANVMLLRFLFRVPRHFFSQVFIVCIGALSTWFFYLFQIAGLSPFGLDAIPFGFLVMGIIVYLGLTNLNLFRIQPIAYRELFKGLSDGVVFVGNSGNIIEINEKAKEQLKLNNDSMEETIVADWPEIYEMIIDANNLAVKEIKRPGNDSMIFLKLSPSSIKDKKGNMIGKIITIKDITLKVEANIQAKKLLEVTSEQNKRLSNFTYIVSHNLRSNIVNMEGLLSIIDLDHRKETEEHLELVKESVVKLEQTIQNLNEIINIQNNVSLPMTEFEIKPKVEEIALSVSNLLKEADIELIINIDAHETIITNSAYFESIILNLITNGIKYRNKDLKPYIKISYKRMNNKMKFIVEDNGLGMDMQKVGDKLFGMYKTFHNNSDAKGIGLFITKSQIEALNGNVEVESKVNQGTKFKITFHADN